MAERIEILFVLGLRRIRGSGVIPGFAMIVSSADSRARYMHKSGQKSIKINLLHPKNPEKFLECAWQTGLLTACILG